MIAASAQVAALDAAVVLCGGRSRRMGRDKAELELGGEALLARVARAAAEAAPRVWLACGPEPRYRELGLELVLDRAVAGGAAAGGPLAGIEAALARLAREPERDNGGWLGVVACDMPRAAGECLRLCAARGRALGLDAVFLESALRGIEPLFGAVHARALLAVRAALERGERRADAFHPAVAVGVLPLADLPAPLRDAARNVNTPEDLARERDREDAR